MGTRGWRDPSPRTKVNSSLLSESLHRIRLVILDVEDGVQLGDLEQVVDFFGEVQQLQLAALVLSGRESANQLADSRAIDVVHVAEVQQDFLVSLGEQV